jgi:hypothetical protein
MAAALTITFGKAPVQDNWQHTQRFRTSITISDGIYPVGGIPIDKAMAAALLPTSNRTPRALQAVSLNGSGFVYDYIRTTGKLMVLVVPPSGSLTSQAPLQELNSDAFHKVSLDTIQITVEYDRNA